MSHNNYNSNFDVSGHVYTPNDVQNPSGVTAITFAHLGDIIFWMPNSHAYRSKGTIYHPPFSLEYLHFTKNTGASG